MILLSKLVSFSGLVLTLLPAILLFAGKLETTQNYQLMLLGMILWFISAPYWMLKK